MIKIEQLHKRFGKNKVLKGIDLTFDQKGIVAVLGPNGSGKTTLIKALLGMVIPDKGTLSVEDVSIKSNWKYRDQIDYLPQIANFPSNLTVQELIAMITDIRNRTVDDKRLIALFKLEPFLSKKLSTLSGGTKQKVNLVLTLMFDSPIIILDEPTTGLDPIAMIHLKALIKEERAKGKIILITSHIMSFVEEMADEIVFLLEGKVYFKGNVQQLKTQTNQSNFEHAIANLLNQDNA
jgi:Cu-processing system ATP-binding protein